MAGVTVEVTTVFPFTTGVWAAAAAAAAAACASEWRAAGLLLKSHVVL